MPGELLRQAGHLQEKEYGKSILYADRKAGFL